MNADYGRTEGPAFRWFAWHPVDTKDRGWRWLRMVWRRRVVIDNDTLPTIRYFDTSVKGWGQP